MREINLLPKIRQQEFQNELIVRSLYFVIWISCASFVLVLALQYATKLYLQNRLQSTQNRTELLISQVNKQDNAQIKQKIKAINNVITDYKNLLESTPKWSKVIEAFAVLPPSEVNINTFIIDAAKKSITITGASPTRELVIALHDKIEQDQEHFYNIDFPLENIVKAKDVSFHFTFFIKDELFK